MHNYFPSDFVLRSLFIEDDQNDAFWLAQIYFMTHQYSRAERLLTRPFQMNEDIIESVEPLTNGHTFPNTPFPTVPGGIPFPQLDKGKGREIAQSMPSTGSRRGFVDAGSNVEGLDRLPIGPGAPDLVAEQLEGVVKLVDVSVACRYLAAQCQVRQGKWAEATEMLGEVNPFRETGESL